MADSQETNTEHGHNLYLLLTRQAEVEEMWDRKTDDGHVERDVGCGGYPGKGIGVDASPYMLAVPRLPCIRDGLTLPDSDGDECAQIYNTNPHENIGRDLEPSVGEDAQIEGQDGELSDHDHPVIKTLADIEELETFRTFVGKRWMKTGPLP